MSALYCTGCGREWGTEPYCICPEDDPDNPSFMKGPWCHVCGVKHPSDYEHCGECWFDHAYEPEQAAKWHADYQKLKEAIRS